MVIVCLVLLVVQIGVFLYAVCKKGKFQWLMSTVPEVVSLATGAGMAVYFNGLPGKGEAPGLTYFAETMGGMGLAVVSVIFLLVSVLILIIQPEKILKSES